MTDKNTNNQVLDSQTTQAISVGLNSNEIPESLKASMKQKILNNIHNQAEQSISTIRETEGEWLDVAPKLQMKVLRRDNKLNSQTALWKLEPGAIIPAHEHPVEEECLVIKGEINFADHVLHEGDFEVVPAGINHIEMQSKTGAIVLLRSDIPEDLSWIE